MTPGPIACGGPVMIAIPDFFQDESEGALRLQVEWQEKHLGLSDRFFAKLLRVDQRFFSGWRKDMDALTTAQEDLLRDWWQTILHLLSFQQFDDEKVRSFLKEKADTHSLVAPSVFSPPWFASSLREYVESHGREAIGGVNRWMESFKFGDPYAPRLKESSCLSTQT
jgi:hypothetical protein